MKSPDLPQLNTRSEKRLFLPSLLPPSPARWGEPQVGTGVDFSSFFSAVERHGVDEMSPIPLGFLSLCRAGGMGSGDPAPALCPAGASCSEQTLYLNVSTNPAPQDLHPCLGGSRSEPWHLVLARKSSRCMAAPGSYTMGRGPSLEPWWDVGADTSGGFCCSLWADS